MSTAALELLISLKDEASAGLGSITGSLGGLGKATLAVAGGGLLAIGGGLTAAIGAGLNFNNSMEQVSAQLMAFTKDGGKTAEILEMIKQRAASTPFAFEDMATAATALLPASKAAGVGLEDLIAQAEILAASNPAEGLEGAAFALKEATGGDFQSAIERFNLPRQYINQLKEEGVPNLEILSRAMGQLGLDSDLVSGLANTASGRWSTFLDTMTNVAATISAPIFTALSSGLAGIQGQLDANMPAIMAFADALANQVGVAIQWLIGTGVPMLVSGWQSLSPVLATVGAALTTAGAMFGQIVGYAQPLIDLLGGNLMPILAALGTVLGGAVLVALGGIVAGFVAAVAPIAALVAGLALLYAAFNSNFLGIQTIVTSVLGAVISIVTTVGGQIAAVWQANGATIMAAAQAAWGALLGLVSSVLSGVLGVVSAVGGQIAAFWQANGASIMATVQATWAQLGAIISGAIQIAIAIITTLSSVVTTVFGGIASFIQSNTASIQAVLTGAWQVIQGVITAAMGVVQGVIRTVLAAIQGDWSGVWAGLSQIVSSAISGIGSVLAGLGNIVRGALGLLGGVIAEAAAAAGRAALGLGKSIVDGIMSGLSAAAGRLTKAVSDLAKGALDAAKSALGIKSPSREFAQQVGAPSALGIAAGFTAAMPKVTTNLVNGVAGLMEKVASAVENGSKALSAVAGFQGASGSGLSGFLAAIKDMAIQFNDAATVLGGRILGTATRFADTIGKVTAPIDGALKALGGLVDFVAPARANISAFIASMYVLLNALNNMAVMFESKAIKAAAVFAEGAAKMLAVVSPAIDALKKLPDLVSPTWTQVNAFGEALYKIVTELLNVAALFESRSLQAGAAFGEAGAKLLAVVGPAIDALKKLPDLVAPTDAAIWLFADALRRVVTQLIAVAAFFAQDAVDAAAKFAEGAGKVLGILKAGVEGLNAVREFGPVGYEAITAFAMAVDQMVALMAQVAEDVGVAAADAAAKFAEGAGKVLAIVKTGVDGFVVLRDLGPIGYQAIAAFAMAVDQIVAYMAMAADDVGVAAAEAAAKFSEGAGKVLAIIKSGVEGLTGLRDLGPVGVASITRFVMAVDQIVAYMAMAAEDVGVAAAEAAAAFAAGAGKVLALLKTGVDGLTSLAEFAAPAPKAIQAFGTAIVAVLRQIEQVSATFSAEAVATAAAFSANVSTVVNQIKSALQAFASLGDTTVKPAVLGAFMQAAQSLIAQMAAYLPPNAEVIGANTIVGLINGIYSQRSNLIAAMTNTVLAAVQAAQATLGIASPSKVFEQIGQYTGQGMAGGMSAMQPAVASAGAGLGMAAVGGAAGGVGGSSRSAGAAGSISITFAAGAIAINGVQGGLNDKHLKALAGYIKEDIAADIGKR